MLVLDKFLNILRPSGKISNTLQATRYFWGLPINTPTGGLHGDMGWLTPGYNIYLHKVRLWNKRTSKHPYRVIKNIFEWDWLKRYNNWSSELCTMFNKLDMSNVFYNQGVCNIKDAQRNFEILCANEWKASLSSYPKLRTYCKFKTMFRAEPYILTILPISKRYLLAQLQIAVLPQYKLVDTIVKLLKPECAWYVIPAL